MKEQLASVGFILKETTNKLYLNESFLNRYPRIPSDYLDFLLKTEDCANNKNTAWFNTVSDFNEQNSENSAFAWNEFEIQSLEVFEGDQEEQEVIHTFWNQYIPFLLSVEGEYSYFSICVTPDDLGKIFFGAEPEYEEPTLIADSFTAFIEKVVNKDLETYYLERLGIE